MSAIVVAQPSVERVANYLVGYIAQRYGDSQHVRRVASWLGFLLLGIDRLAPGAWWRAHTRQVRFEHEGHTYKVRYVHAPPSRGRIQVVRLPTQVVLELRSLLDAQRFYDERIAGRSWP